MPDRRLLEDGSYRLQEDGTSFRLLEQQYVRPTADAQVASWTTSPLWSKIDESVPDDGDEISSEVLVATGDTSQAWLTLPSLTDPASSVGHIIRVRGKVTFTLGTAATFKAELRQSGTLIATLTFTPTTSYATYTYTLSGAEADSISNYGALQLRLYATFAVGNLGGVQVSFAEFETPGITSLTFSTGDTGSGADANGSVTASAATETGAGTEGIPGQVGSAADTGSGLDGDAGAAATAADAASGTEGLSPVTSTTAEVGAGVDVTLGVAVAAADVGAGAEAILPLAVTAGDVGSAVEAAVLVTAVVQPGSSRAGDRPRRAGSRSGDRPRLASSRSGDRPRVAGSHAGDRQPV